MKTLTSLLLVVAASSTGCTLTLADAKNAANVTLDAAQVSCIVLSHLTDEQAVMKACEIAADLRPTVKGLLGQRAAMRAGLIAEEVRAGRLSPAAGASACP